ncbi:extracellular solute-binding protein [Bosea sp. LjRoot9]|uniref:ABC transporter substrate-binding protein n=1 Tax=Bosea sp. LjRoot9 TaxID=3342341 RepID=UPI003ECE0681
MSQPSRRGFNILAAGGLFSCVGLAARAQRTGRLVVGNWGGDSQKGLEDYIVNPYLKKEGIEVAFDAAAEPARKVKIMAERALPRGTMDIAGLTDTGAFELWKNGAVADIDYTRIVRASEIIPAVKKPYMIPKFFSTRVILYNPDKLAEAPQSYADLWDPALTGRVGAIDLQYRSTIESAAFINGGSISNYEPGKEKLLELKKAGLKIYPTNEAMAQALKSGECWICIMWQARGVMWQNAGIPIKIAFPKEGLGLELYGFSMPKNARNKDEAYKFLNANLQDDTQISFAKDLGYAPVLNKPLLPDEYSSRVGIPKGMEDKVFLPDNEYLLKNDAQLKDWWDKVLKA